MVKILLVEDEIMLAQVIQHELNVIGYDVLHSEDGQSALQLFTSYSPDLMILDWILPKMNGLDVLRNIRKESPIPVIMLTARGEITDRVVGLEAGADDYLVKPFNISELVARVHALLRREERIRELLNKDQAKTQTPILYGPLKLDPVACSCTLNEKPLELTALEFDFLSLLTAHPGRTFNRMYLIETVWKTVYIEGDRSVDNTVLRLRKKMDSIGDCIETVRSVGYRMRPIKTANFQESDPKK